MNKDLLRGIMALHGDTYSDLAEFLGISTQSMTNKINENGTEFKQGEIAAICQRYDLTPKQIKAIFFA